MAIKPTIYKFIINLSDLDKNYYDALNLTVALHPSETIERMMTRVVAFTLNAEDKPVFTKGLSEPDEPDIIAKTLDNQIKLWIDVGEPSMERVKKASRLANSMKIYTFNSKSDSWWQQSREKSSRLNVHVVQFDWLQIQSLARLVSRTMQFACTITGNTAYIATDSGECEITWETLQDQKRI